MLTTSRSKIRVAIVDSHPLVVQGLIALFRSEGDFDVVATCRDGSETLVAVGQNAAEVIVVDPRLPGIKGLEVIRQIRLADATVRIVVHTAALGDDELAEAKRLGISGVVLKEMALAMLIRCVREGHAGKPWLEDGSLARALEKSRRREAAAKSPVASLTGREVEVVRLAATGVRNREVARRLGISECTVKAHLSNVYEKLGLESRLELSLYASSAGLL